MESWIKLERLAREQYTFKAAFVKSCPIGTTVHVLKTLEET